MTSTNVTGNFGRGSFRLLLLCAALLCMTCGNAAVFRRSSQGDRHDQGKRPTAFGRLSPKGIPVQLAVT